MDARRRELERAARSGDEEARSLLANVQLRNGELHVMADTLRGALQRLIRSSESWKEVLRTNLLAAIVPSAVGASVWVVTHDADWGVDQAVYANERSAYRAAAKWAIDNMGDDEEAAASFELGYYDEVLDLGYELSIYVRVEKLSLQP